MEVLSVQPKYFVKYICVIKETVINKTRYNHRIIEWFGSEKTFKDHVVYPPAKDRDIFH